MYQNGNGVEKADYNEAINWYREAAENEDPLAQNNLGWMYQQGLGVEQSLEISAYWCEEAAKQGYEIAQYNLGWMYENGKGVDKDYDQAAIWYKKAADPGDEQAKDKLTSLNTVAGPKIHDAGRGKRGPLLNSRSRRLRSSGRGTPTPVATEEPELVWKTEDPVKPKSLDEKLGRTDKNSSIEAQTANNSSIEAQISNSFNTPKSILEAPKIEAGTRLVL